jgi:hypothetical protein
MPYLVIDKFQYGLDLRKSPLTASAESLRVLRNAVINAGAEVEKRRAFVKQVSVPGTVGLYGDGSEFVVFKPNDTAGDRQTLSTYVNSYGIAGGGFSSLSSAQPWDGGYFTTFEDTTNKQVVYNKGALVKDVNGRSAKLYGSKMYLGDGPNLRFSDILDPGSWDPTKDPNEGAGFIDVSKAELFGTSIAAVERYYDYLAVFGASNIQLWGMDPDPKKNALKQSVGNTGLYAPNAITAFANGDVLYLAQTGLRSLRARDASNYAMTADIGSPVDTYIRDRVRNLTPEQLKLVNGVVEPKTGAFWLTLGNEIMVFSFFPSSKIAAWSIFDAPGDVDYIATNDYALALRCGDDIYIYGGDYNQSVFDDCEAIVQTPYLDAQKPATVKVFQGFDASVDGVWDVRYNLNPYLPDAWSNTATLTGETYTLQRLPMQGVGSHISLELRTKFSGKAKLSSLVVHFEGRGSE